MTRSPPSAGCKKTSKRQRAGCKAERFSKNGRSAFASCRDASESLLHEISFDVSYEDPVAAAIAVVTQLLNRGDRILRKQGLESLKEQLGAYGDPRWFELLVTLPSDEERNDIFFTEVRMVRARNPQSYVSPTVYLPEDDSPNPQILILRSWIEKLRLSAEHQAEAEAALKAVEDQEETSRRERRGQEAEPEEIPGRRR